MRDSITAAIKPVIERILNLGAQFCIAVKAGVFRGRAVEILVTNHVALCANDHGGAVSSRDDIRSQIIPERLGGQREFSKAEFRENVKLRTSPSSAEEIITKKHINILLKIFKNRLNELIPAELRDLRKTALEEASQEVVNIYLNSLELGQSMEEAKKKVEDSNILTEYENKAREKVDENKCMNYFRDKFNELIPNDVKYLRKDALEKALSIYKNSLGQGKSMEEAKKDIEDSKILTEYENKAKMKIAENKAYDRLWDSEGNFVGVEEAGINI
ncbi:hypothetical protein IWQ51_004138 [Labrenzia sp. EL_142]|nr:hypothetical protein [Labrenzia sp. EL_142]